MNLRKDHYHTEDPRSCRPWGLSLFFIQLHALYIFDSVLILFLGWLPWYLHLPCHGLCYFDSSNLLLHGSRFFCFFAELVILGVALILILWVFLEMPLTKQCRKTGLPSNAQGEGTSFSWDAADKVVSQDWDSRAMLKGKAHPLFSIYQRCWILIWIKSTFLLFRFRGNIWSESFFQWLTSMTNISKSREDIVGSIPISNKVQLSATDV